MAVVSPDCLQSHIRHICWSTIDPGKVFLVKMKTYAHLPDSAEQLADARTVARRIYHAIRTGQPLCLLRFGDTGGRILSRPTKDSTSWDYIMAFLGRSVSEHQVEWLAQKIEQSAAVADIVGLRSDLLGPRLPDNALSLQGSAILETLRDTYPIRPVESHSLLPDDARRLMETRAAMERMRFSADAVFTNAWSHVDLLEIGFVSAMLKEVRVAGLVTSSTRKPLVARIAGLMQDRLRYFECPAYPSEERQFGADHAHLWHRWESLFDTIAPEFPGQPLLISAGIWTKPLAVAWRSRGGVAVDFGSALDYLDGAATRPSVLGHRYGNAHHVPTSLTLVAQFARTEPLSSFA